MIRKGTINSSCNKIVDCEFCHIGKAHALPHKSSKSVYNRPLELIYADIWGPSPVYSIDGFKYFINFVDACTHFNWIFMLTTKSQVIEVFDKFKKMVELQSGYKIKCLQTDNALEFKKLSKHIAEMGIQHRLSVPYTINKWEQLSEDIGTLLTLQSHY